MNNYALVNSKGVVENVFTWDGAGNWEIPSGYSAIKSDAAKIGDTFIKGVLVNTVVSPTEAQLLAQAQAAQLALTDVACAAAITAGINSSALGDSYTYPSDQIDQANLNANVVSSLIPNLPENWSTMQMCCDSKGNWGYVAHTAQQIQQVGQDVKSGILKFLIKNATLKAEIAAATTVAAIQSITWS